MSAMMSKNGNNHPNAIPRIIPVPSNENPIIFPQAVERLTPKKRSAISPIHKKGSILIHVYPANVNTVLFHMIINQLHQQLTVSLFKV